MLTGFENVNLFLNVNKPAAAIPESGWWYSFFKVIITFRIITIKTEKNINAKSWLVPKPFIKVYFYLFSNVF